MPPDHRVRDARLRAGLSQAQLARAAGLSRQAVGAVEAGHHRPSVDAAIALAGALGRPVEALFGPQAPATGSVPLLGDDVPAGTPVLTGRVGARRVHAAADLAAWQERWPVADGRWTGSTVEPWDDEDAATDEGFVVVGCDPALALAAAQLPAHGPHRLVAVNGSTRSALAALAGGRAHGALVHGRPGTLPAAPPGTLRLHLARWRVGLAAITAPTSLTRLTRAAGGALVQREAGASSQQALVRALDAEGVPVPDGPVATGHLAVTQRVLAGAPAGVTMEPAAVHTKLAFLPLEEHTVQLWVAAEHREHPGCDALAQALASRAFTRRLTAVGGYDLTGCGLSLPEIPA